MQPEPQALAQQIKKDLTGLFLIVSDGSACTTAVAKELQRLGVQPAILFPVALVVESGSEGNALADKLTELRAQYGSVRGIVNLAGLAKMPEADNLEQWRQYSDAHCRGFFSLLQLCAEDLTRPEETRWLMSATCFGGYFGRHTGRHTYAPGTPPLSGACLGLLKTLGKEWPTVTTKSIDVDETLSPGAIAQILIQELQHPGRLEVGYPAGERTIFKTIEVPFGSTFNNSLDSARSSGEFSEPIPTSDWVALVTGGAKGITAEIVADLASVGLSLVIVGRSPLPQMETVETLGIKDTAQLRQRLLAMAQANGEQFTPVMIEARLRKLKGNREMTHYLAQFESLGAAVDYRSLDVRDDNAMQGLLADVYQRYGRLDAVIHGAGVIEDKLLANKSLDSYDRVFETKVDSAYLLTRYLRPESLKLLVFFASVAGRYGNPGQSDYAAANEVLMRLAWQLDSQWSQTRVLSVAWGPWDGGMASAQVKAQFRAQGIVPIEIESGRAFLQQEIALGLKGDTEVIAGEGPWEQHEAKAAVLTEVLPEAALANRVDTLSNQSIPLSDLPLGLLLREPPQLQADGSWLGNYWLSLERDHYLTDHRLDNQPVLPATVALEWLAELAQASQLGWQVSQVRDLRLLSGVVLLNDHDRAIRLSASAPEIAEETAIEGVGKTARTIRLTAQMADPQTQRLHYRAVVELQPQSAPLPAPLDTLGSPSGSPLDSPSGNSEVISGTEVYHRYLFHGPCFQRIKRLKISPLGIDAQLAVSPPEDWGLSPAGQHWIFDPGLLDVGPQLAIVWLRHYRKTTALPTHFPTIIRHQTVPLSGPAKVCFRVVQEDAFNLIYTAIFTDAHGTPWYSLQNAHSVGNSKLNRLSD